MILIRNVVLKNFRGHKNTTVDVKDESGVFFISGDNGAGKTTLMNAINWCLYGNIIFSTIYDDTAQRIKTNGANEDEPVEVKIILSALDRKYQFKRTASHYDEKGVLSVIELIGETGNSKELIQYEIESVIKKILPQNIKGLFFLNGDNFSTEIFSHKSVNSLKANIYKVSELDTIDNAIRHLGLAENQYIKNIDKTTTDYDKIQKLNKDKEQSNSMLVTLKNDMEHARDKIKEHEEELNKFDELLSKTKGAQEYVVQRKEILADKKDLESLLFKNNADVSDCFQSNFHKVLLLDGINEYRNALIDANKKGKIPSPVNPKVTQDILDSGLCICGRYIKEEQRNFINELHKKYEEIDKLKFLTDGIYEFSNIKNQIKNNYQILRDAISDKEKNNEKMSHLEDRLDNVKDKLNGINEASLPDNPEEKRKHINYDIEKWKIRLRGYAEAQNEHEDSIIKINNELVRLLKSGGEDLSNLTIELDRIRNLQHLLNLLRDDTEITIRKRIQKGIWDTYYQILTDTQFSDILIDENYNFKLSSKQGQEYNAGSISVGELKTLALSLIYTLSNDIGYSDTPLFIDNLFGGIEKTHFSDISKFVETLSKKKQVFITYLYKADSDTSDKISKYFSPNFVKQEFVAIKDSDTGICNIMEDK